ncbi:hypothetical protein JCM14036_30700 [Desulfotomaculum defluvii]
MNNDGYFNKIIYFDKETISNILQELNKGAKATQTGTTTSVKGSAGIEVGAKVKLAVPFLERLSFLFSGNISLSYVLQRDSTTTLTSTEVSEFEKLKPHLKEMKEVKVNDIENSSTFFRVAGGYLKMIKGGVDGVDIKEFNKVMDNYDGYDTYKVSKDVYVRFNNSAFISNYKRNDLLTTKMNIYCVLIGEFEKENFDFFKQIYKMESLITGVNKSQSLADLYPAKDSKLSEEITEDNDTYSSHKVTYENDKINLYDVVYASIPFGGTDEK